MIPKSPGDDVPMDGFTLSNPNSSDIFIGVFNDSLFTNTSGEGIKHAECSIFPMTNQDYCWIAFLEIKDCKPRNITNYNVEVRQKIENCKNEFLSRGVSTKKNRYYGIASFPRKKIDFDDSIFNDPSMQKAILDETGIRLFAANEVKVLDDNHLVPVWK